MGFRKRFAATSLAVVIAALVVVSTAASEPPPEFKQFAQCPYENLEVERCVYWVTNGGSYTVGSRTIPLVNPITFQGGYTGSQFFGAENGVTISKTPQPVPGGLAGVTAPNTWPQFLQEWFNELMGTGFTGVSATIELAQPASAIEVNAENLLVEEGTALSLPVRIKLENASFGGSCYIGTEGKPVQLQLSTGESGALTGTAGTLTFNPKATLATFTGIELVDGTFTAPATTGCGGAFSSYVNPFVSSLFGVPSGSEENSAVLEGVFQDADAAAIRP